MDATMAAKKRNDRAVKVEAEIIRKAQTICAYRVITLAEYLSEILRPVVERDFEQFSQELASQAPQPPKKPRK